MDRSLLYSHLSRLVVTVTVLSVISATLFLLKFELELPIETILLGALYISSTWTVLVGHQSDLFRTLKRLGWIPLRGVLIPYLFNVSLLCLLWLCINPPSNIKHSSIHFTCNHRVAKAQLCLKTEDRLNTFQECQLINHYNQPDICLDTKNSHQVLYPFQSTIKKKGTDWSKTFNYTQSWSSLFEIGMSLLLLSSLFLGGVCLPLPQISNPLLAIVAVSIEYIFKSI